jgi:hypothetical protein
MDAASAERVRVLLKEDIDWSALIRAALRHGVMPLVYRSLHTTCPEAVPQTILAQLREHFYANAGHNAFLTKALLKLLPVLEAQGIPAIPYKGPVLAVSVYGHLALRQCGDLDILVHERDYRRVQQLLIAHGYQLIKEYEWEMSLVDKSGQIGVDLHRGITPREFPFPLRFEHVWERRQPLALTGTIVPTLSPEDLLLVLCVQITKDVWGQDLRLAKVCDLAELLRVHPRLNWAQVRAETRRLGSQRMLTFCLHLTSQLLGRAHPQDLLEGLPWHPSLNVLVEHAQQLLLHGGAHTIRDQCTADHFHWAVRERFRDKVFPYYCHYFRNVLIPTEKDRALLPLPAWLSFLYYFLRPMRLVGDRLVLRSIRWVMHALYPYRYQSTKEDDNAS